MELPEFSNQVDLMEYVISAGSKHGAELSDSIVQWIREDARANQAPSAMHHILDNYGLSDDGYDHLCDVIRENIRLAAGSYQDVELADRVGAPWDCFA